MKKYLLLSLLLIFGLLVGAQISSTYTSVTSGNYNSPATWGGALGAPPASGTCNCKIIIAANTTVKFSANTSLTNANFGLEGNNSVLTFDNNVDITLLGTSSSFNLTTAQARIVRGNPNNNITLGGQVVYDGGTTRVNSTTDGTVNGPASITAANPVWNNAALPVSLSEFKAVSKSNNVNLTWVTDLEINSSHFEIERSNNSKEWSKIGSVNAAGNTGVSQNYSYTDNSPLQGNNYYRLRIVDIDAKYEFSPIRNVIIAISGLAVTAGPNPAYGTLNVMIAQTTAKDFQVKLINRSGQIMHNKKYSGSLDRISIEVSKFPEGNYFVEVNDANGAKIIKNILILRK